MARKNLANKLQSVHMPNTFLVYLWILAKKILANSPRFTKFTNFSPAKYFLCTVASVKSISYALPFYCYVSLHHSYLCTVTKAHCNFRQPYHVHSNICVRVLSECAVIKLINCGTSVVLAPSLLSATWVHPALQAQALMVSCSCYSVYISPLPDGL